MAAPNKKVSPLGALFGLIALGLSIWFLFADIFPANKINEIQDKIFGDGHYPALTMMLTLIIVYAPLWAIDKLVQKVRKKDEPENPVNPGN